MSQYCIALQNLDHIDFEVISQAITYNYPKITIQNNIDPETSLVITGDSDNHYSNIPSLAPSRRIGILLDEIEKCLFTTTHENISVGPYTLSVKDMTLSLRDKVIDLTETELNIIATLLKCDGMNLSRDQLLKSIWGYVDGVETHTLETHIYRLRQKIEDEPDNPKYLVTIDGGYGLA